MSDLMTLVDECEQVAGAAMAYVKANESELKERLVSHARG